MWFKGGGVNIYNTRFEVMHERFGVMHERPCCNIFNPEIENT